MILDAEIEQELPLLRHRGRFPNWRRFPTLLQVRLQALLQCRIESDPIGQDDHRVLIEIRFGVDDIVEDAPFLQHANDAGVGQV